MCIVEQKTYYHPDGSQKAVDKTRRCVIAINSDISLCSNVTHTSNAARIVEVRPETTTSSSIRKDGFITDSNGRTRIYLDICRQSSHKHKTGHSKRPNDRSSIDDRPSRQSPASETINTRRSSPVSCPATPNSAPRMGSFPPTLPSEHSVRVDLNGTAIYDLPPPLHMPRASENERRPVNDFGRKVSFKTDSADQTARPRRPSLTVHTEPHQPTNTIPTKSSPGLSRLPSLRHKRTDSGYGRVPQGTSPTSPKDQKHSGGESARETARLLRRQEELEAAENLQLDREAQRAQHRRSFDPLHRFSPAPSTTDSSHSSWSRHTSPLSHQRHAQPRTRFASSSPLATNSSHHHRSYGPATIHQYHYPDSPADSSRRRSHSINERGREVIERERAKAAAEDRHPAIEDDARAGAAEFCEPVFDDFDVEERVSASEYVFVSQGPARQEIRKRRGRDNSRRRGERREEFFR